MKRIFSAALALAISNPAAYAAAFGPDCVKNKLCKVPVNQIYCPTPAVLSEIIVAIANGDKAGGVALATEGGCKKMESTMRFWLIQKVETKGTDLAEVRIDGGAEKGWLLYDMTIADEAPAPAK